MKKLILILATSFAFSLCLTAQDLIFEETTIEIQEDTLYFLKSITVTDNGTTYPDTAISRTLLGDSTQAAFYVLRNAIEEQQFIAAQIAKSFDRQKTKTSFNAYRDLYESITGAEMYVKLGNDYKGRYLGRWRFYDELGGSLYFVLIQNPNGRYRLTKLTGNNGVPVTPTEDWLINPLSNRSFSLVNYNGKTYEFFRDNNAQNEVYRPAEYVASTLGPFRLVKQKDNE